MEIQTFLMQFLQSFSTYNELQILFSQFLVIITDLLTKFIQSLIVGIACHYIIEWLDYVFRKFFKSDNQ